MATRDDKMGPGQTGLRHTTASTVLRARLLLSSYAALFAILALRVDPCWARITLWALAGLGIADAARLTWLAPRGGFARPKVETVRDAGGEIAAYLATYLLPLLAAPDPSGGDLAAYGVYFFVIVIITLRSDLAHVNPTLYLLGRRVVSVKLEHEDRERYLVCRHAPVAGHEIQVSDMIGVLHTRE